MYNRRSSGDSLSLRCDNACRSALWEHRESRVHPVSSQVTPEAAVVPQQENKALRSLCSQQPRPVAASLPPFPSSRPAVTTTDEIRAAQCQCDSVHSLCWSLMEKGDLQLQSL
ncbi:unnamed protein product [Pleuronectes platessa]|uniref:Uncharacterized protein n=1 Tax=Pleuronectes platessa TaxID=8262 RepID=A0A9N7VP61_PLEPL|nr:unnamed protein product [Pleuronectes platessa]